MIANCPQNSVRGIVNDVNTEASIALMHGWLANREENFVLMTFSKQNVKRDFGGFAFLKNV